MDSNTLRMLESEIFVIHRVFEDVFSEVLRFVQYGRGGECLCVIGPTGVGKSKMTLYLVDYLVRRFNAGWGEQYHHPLIIEAPSISARGFPWSAFLKNLLLLLGERDVSKKVNLDEIEERRRSKLYANYQARFTIPDLETLFIERVKAINPILIGIDEAQNMVDGISAVDRKINVNRLKYLANQAKTKFILFGTHESSQFLDLNEQLSRRILPIYFRRYRKNEDDIKLFAQFYLGIKSELKLKFDPRIEDDFEKIYNYSLGCPGLLVTWIHNAISFCLTNGSPVITKEIWDGQRISTKRLMSIEKAIKNFEFKHEMEIGEFNPDLILPDEGQIDMAYNSQNSSNSIKVPRRPGRMKPKRYQVNEP